MQTMKELMGSRAWEAASSPRILFHLDSDLDVSWLYTHIGRAEREGDVLKIQVPGGVVTITGPKVKELHKDFCKGKATLIRVDEDGDITSVKM